MSCLQGISKGLSSSVSSGGLLGCFWGGNDPADRRSALASVMRSVARKVTKTQAIKAATRIKGSMTSRRERPQTLALIQLIIWSFDYQWVSTA